MLRAESYEIFPGRCHLCTGNATPTIDTTRDIDRDGYEGRLYVCVECVGAMATEFGWLRPDRAAELSAATSDLESGLDLAKSIIAERDAKVAELEDTLSKIAAYRPQAKRQPAKAAA